MMKLNDVEISRILNDFKISLDSKNLVNELGMIIKHLPTYNKIVKSHISQLQNILALDSQSIDNVNLSPIVRQLIAIFEQLEEDDLEQLEQLYFAACDLRSQQAQLNITEVSEATL